MERNMTFPVRFHFSISSWGDFKSSRTSAWEDPSHHAIISSLLDGRHRPLQKSLLIWCWWMQPTSCYRPRKSFFVWGFDYGHICKEKRGIDYSHIVETYLHTVEIITNLQSSAIYRWFAYMSIVLNMKSISECQCHQRNLNRLLRKLQQEAGLKLRRSATWSVDVLESGAGGITARLNVVFSLLLRCSCFSIGVAISSTIWYDSCSLQMVFFTVFCVKLSNLLPCKS